MDFTIAFVKVFLLILAWSMPLFLFFLIAIAALGLLVGRIEQWSRFESIYFAFITATTVGYGDYRPLSKRSRSLAVLIAFLGLVFSGIMVGIAVNSANVAFKHTRDIKEIAEDIRDVLGTEDPVIQDQTTQ